MEQLNQLSANDVSIQLVVASPTDVKVDDHHVNPDAVDSPTGSEGDELESMRSVSLVLRSDSGGTCPLRSSDLLIRPVPNIRFEFEPDRIVGTIRIRPNTVTIWNPNTDS